MVNEPKGLYSRATFLFLIYVNDSCLSSKHFILFADDTNLFFSHKNLKTLYFKMNAELSKINEWFKTNK